ncbi:hypothetical protein BDS110ZK25_40380 [Bradyrhizobium diazoefficiens]|uniref:Uncharacterized protein n=1 Tax=Bradyrhizobium diazoefficiens TaxID=1355477 RepID=A0A810AH15_9BRAD|nr:hypothetical protein XF1B_08750 [Bradyrhizobium diazoefficiens]BCE27034.1 hypothetical protein XF2B_08030 [Bradyrhizobium diazoefficiens]BCE62008.1 hypothetical protein XF6B_08070 [Bradyrhizobium diazoefficiens]BCF22922.1 hypothetical protein XF14B_08740 [Bradyrhizobium diazoefficiens]
MASTLAEQEPAQRHALPRRAEPGGLEHFVNVVPRAAGQSRLAAGQEGRGMDVVVVMGRGILAHFQISGTREQ